MLASTRNLAMPSEDPPQLETPQNENRVRKKLNDPLGIETASNNSYQFYANKSVNDHSRPADVTHQLVYLKGMVFIHLLMIVRDNIM